jgi:hypothetical protein
VDEKENDVEGIDRRLSELLIAVAGIVTVAIQEAKLLGKTVT